MKSCAVLRQYCSRTELQGTDLFETAEPQPLPIQALRIQQWQSYSSYVLGYKTAMKLREIPPVIHEESSLFQCTKISSFR